MRRKSLWLKLGLATIASLASAASAVTVDPSGSLDLRTGGAGVINGATFSTTEIQPTGSGVIHSFVRVNSPGPTADKVEVEGYNTDARPLQFDENSSPTFTHQLNVNALINENGYYKFLLDINQTKSSPDLTLNELQIFLGNAPDLNPNTKNANGLVNFGTSADLIYDLDAGAVNPTSDLNNSRIQLNYALNSGSGSGDMYAYIPVSAFAASTKQWVYLYSRFGPQEFANNDGYEEWATLANPNLVVPIPAAVWGGMALCGFVGAGKLRRRTQE